MTSASANPDLLEKVTEIITEHSSSVRLHRLDQTPTSFQVDFSVSFSDYAALTRVRGQLMELQEDIEVCLLDQHGF